MVMVRGRFQLRVKGHGKGGVQVSMQGFGFGFQCKDIGSGLSGFRSRGGGFSGPC